VAEEGGTEFPQPRHWRAESEAGPGMANAARRLTDSETLPSPSSVSASPIHLPPLGEGVADALRWAIDAGILPEGVDPADTPTLAAVAEMFYLCRQGCGKEDST
jgi:hypothetical protein